VGSATVGPERRKARALLASAAATATRKPDDPKAAQTVIDRRRDYHATALEEHIKRIVNEAPPLTDEQISHLRDLLPAVITNSAD
jgi:hypothetical protein